MLNMAIRKLLMIMIFVFVSVVFGKRIDDSMEVEIMQLEQDESNSRDARPMRFVDGLMSNVANVSAGLVKKLNDLKSTKKSAWSNLFKSDWDHRDKLVEKERIEGRKEWRLIRWLKETSEMPCKNAPVEVSQRLDMEKDELARIGIEIRIHLQLQQEDNEREDNGRNPHIVRKYDWSVSPTQTEIKHEWKFNYRKEQKQIEYNESMQEYQDVAKVIGHALGRPFKKEYVIETAKQAPVDELVALKGPQLMEHFPITVGRRVAIETVELLREAAIGDNVYDGFSWGQYGSGAGGWNERKKAMLLKRMVCDSLDGLAFMHSRGVLHCGITPTAIFAAKGWDRGCLVNDIPNRNRLGNTCRFMIGDLFHAVEKAALDPLDVWESPFSPPEVVAAAEKLRNGEPTLDTSDRWTEKGDVWSLGMSLLYVFAKQIVDRSTGLGVKMSRMTGGKRVDRGIKTLLDKLYSGQMAKPANYGVLLRALEDNEWIPEGLKNVFGSMMAADPSDRVDAQAAFYAAIASLEEDEKKSYFLTSVKADSGTDEHDWSQKARPCLEQLYKPDMLGALPPKIARSQTLEDVVPAAVPARPVLERRHSVG